MLRANTVFSIPLFYLEESMKRIKKWKWLLPILITLMTVILLKSVFLFGYVPTASMEPTLPKGSYIVGLRIYTDLEKGDIIIFRHDGMLLVKRIAAVEGEYVERNEEFLLVPEGCYYVLGDNAENSLDSRYWEEPFVKEEEIVAKYLVSHDK